MIPQPAQNIFAQRMGMQPQHIAMPTWGAQAPIQQMPVGAPVRPVGPAMPTAPGFPPTQGTMAQPMPQPAWGSQPPISMAPPVQAQGQPNQGILQNPNVQNFLRQRMGMSY